MHVTCYLLLLELHRVSQICLLFSKKSDYSRSQSSRVALAANLTKHTKNRANNNRKEMNFLRHLQISKTLPNATKLAASKTRASFIICVTRKLLGPLLQKKIVQFLDSHEDNHQNASVTCQGSSILKHFCPKHRLSSFGAFVRLSVPVKYVKANIDI